MLFLLRHDDAPMVTDELRSTHDHESCCKMGDKKIKNSTILRHYYWYDGVWCYMALQILSHDLCPRALCWPFYAIVVNAIVSDLIGNLIRRKICNLMCDDPIVSLTRWHCNFEDMIVGLGLCVDHSILLCLVRWHLIGLVIWYEEKIWI